MVLNTRNGGVSVTTTSNSQLEVRFARNRRDVKAAQLLRYRIFYKEMGASANLRTKFLRRDFDHFDRACDHLLVIDRRRRWMRPVTPGSVVGTCRLIRRAVADQRGGFYSAGEFDLTPLLNGPGECLEVGRSCVDPEYRTGAVIDRMWRGIADYIVAHRIGVLFGCASLPGTRPDQLAELLSYLHHHHLAPDDVRPRAVAGRYVDMCMRPGRDRSEARLVGAAAAAQGLSAARREDRRWRRGRRAVQHDRCLRGPADRAADPALRAPLPRPVRLAGGCLSGIHNPALAAGRAVAGVVMTGVLLVPGVLTALTLGRVPPWLKRAWHRGCCALFGLEITVRGEPARPAPRSTSPITSPIWTSRCWAAS